MTVAAELAPRSGVCIAVDCMGGDHGPSATLPACRAFLAAHPDAALILVGRIEALAPAREWPRCTLVAATEVVEMDDPIEVALRRKRDSSLRVAISQVKAGADGTSAAQACVSAGNTGALMAVSRYVLKTLDGIDRPAIAAVMPNQCGGYTTVLDLGANVDCTAEHLLQFAVMGSALVASVAGKPTPSVGLLNIGEEEIKGSEVIKRAGELLRQAADRGHLNFHGNVEGNDIFKGTTDIVVCDGFAGNVALKTSEGLAKMLGDFLKEEYTRNWLSRLAAAVSYPVIKRFRRRVDHRRYNGAALLGLKGIVVKSHGSADRLAFATALKRAASEASHGLIERIGEEIARLNALSPSLPPAASPAERAA